MSEPLEDAPAAPRARRWSAPENVLAALLALLTLSSLADLAPKMAGIDYYLYWVIGDAQQKHEIGDVYAPSEEDRVGRAYLQQARSEFRAQGGGQTPSRRMYAAQVRSRLDNYSTPFLYTVYGSFVSGDYERDLDRVQYVSIALYVAGLVAIAWALGHSPFAIAALLAILTVWFSPFTDDTAVANVNRVQVGALGAVIALLRWGRAPWREAAAAFVLALGVAFKPNLAYAAVALGAVWIAQRAWRRIAFAAVGGALAFGVALLASRAWFGSFEVWARWWHKLPSLMPNWAADQGNLSLARVVRDHAGADVSSALPILLLGAVVALVLVQAWRAHGQAAQDSNRQTFALEALALALGAATSVLAVPLAWQHYYLLFVPLALVLLRPAPAERRAAWRRIAAALAVALLSADLLRKLLPGASFDPALGIVAGGLIAYAAGLDDAWRLARDGFSSERRAHAGG